MFHRIDGELFVEEVSLKTISEQYGTPTFVYSAALITEAYQAFTGAFSGQPHDLCYAVKANSNIAILQLLAKLGAGFDIVSGGELQRVIKAGGDPGKTVFSGVGKEDWEITAALKAGIGCINVESRSELDRIARVTKDIGCKAPISIRVNPDVDPKTHPYISTGLKENKFGVSVDAASELYEIAAANPDFNIVGVDCHIGSQITDLSPFLDALARVLQLVDSLELRGITVQHIDLGGGIVVRYKDETPIDLSDFASAVGQAMSGRSERLMFEPGRSIVANAGVLITKVNALKETEDKNFAVVDAAMNDLIRPALYSAWQDVVPVQRTDSSMAEKTWDIVGPICETGDFLAKDRALTLAEDDLLAIMSSGAYGFVMSSNYNSRTRAPEVLVNGNTHHCIRRRETMEDLLSLESLPADG